MTIHLRGSQGSSYAGQHGPQDDYIRIDGVSSTEYVNGRLPDYMKLPLKPILSRRNNNCLFALHAKNECKHVECQILKKRRLSLQSAVTDVPTKHVSFQLDSFDAGNVTATSKPPFSASNSLTSILTVTETDAAVAASCHADRASTASSLPVLGEQPCNDDEPFAANSDLQSVACDDYFVRAWGYEDYHLTTRRLSMDVRRQCKTRRYPDLPEFSPGPLMERKEECLPFSKSVLFNERGYRYLGGLLYDLGGHRYARTELKRLGGTWKASRGPFVPYAAQYVRYSRLNNALWRRYPNLRRQRQPLARAVTAAPLKTSIFEFVDDTLANETFDQRRYASDMEAVDALQRFALRQQEKCKKPKWWHMTAEGQTLMGPIYGKDPSNRQKQMCDRWGIILPSGEETPGICVRPERVLCEADEMGVKAILRVEKLHIDPEEEEEEEEEEEGEEEEEEEEVEVVNHGNESGKNERVNMIASPKNSAPEMNAMDAEAALQEAYDRRSADFHAWLRERFTFAHYEESSRVCQAALRLGTWLCGGDRDAFTQWQRKQYDAALGLKGVRAASDCYMPMASPMMKLRDFFACFDSKAP